MQWPPSARARGSFECLGEPPMQVMLEVHTIEEHGEAGSSLESTCRGRQHRACERDRITHGAAKSDVKLAHEGDLHQCMPGDTARHSAGPSMDARKAVVGEEVISPFLRGLNRKRRDGKTIKSHSKTPVNL